MSKLDLPIIRTSERRCFKRCPQRWWWAYRMGLVGKFRPADALWFGTGIHLALAEWYCGPGLVRGPHPVTTWLKYVKDDENKVKAAVGEHWEDDIWVDARELGEAMLTAYIEEYGKDETWDVIQPEYPFQIRIPKRDGSGDMAIYAGTFDLVFRDLEDGTIWLGEHKTAKYISTSHLPLDDQAGSYWAVASAVMEDKGLLKKGQFIEGIMYNFLQKTMPDERAMDEEGRKLNKNGTVSKRQPKPNLLREPVPRVKAERRQQIVRIQNEISWMNAARRNPDRLFKTTTDNCRWDCSFYEMCLVHEKGGDDWREYAEAMFRVQDPYSDHRKSASE